MTDILVYSLLISILLMLVINNASDSALQAILLWCIGICGVITAGLLIYGVILFAQDPVGSISGFIFHNPLMEFTEAVTENVIYVSNQTALALERGA